jgi:hypothetical protein
MYDDRRADNSSSDAPTPAQDAAIARQIVSTTSAIQASSGSLPRTL